MGTTPPLTPPSFRVAFGTQLEDQPLGVQQAHKTAWNAITDIYQSIGALNTKVEGVKTTATATAATVENITNNSQTIIQQIVSNIGLVNNQTGNTAYTTQQSDQGAFIVLSDSSPIAVTLASAPVIQLPWEANFLNLGTGIATLTPASGTINNLSSLTLTQNGFVTISFDGTNFWLGPPPVVITKGGTVLNPTTGVTIVVWYAPFSATVTNVLGYVDGSTGSVINANRNGTLPLLVSNLTLSTADTWTDGGAVQNTAISVGDKLEIVIVSVSGSPTQIAVEIQCTRP